MTQSELLRQASKLVAEAKDPLAEVRAIVLKNGGFWNDELAECSTQLFEIHLFGISGLGLGAKNAVDDWLKKAGLLDYERENCT